MKIFLVAIFLALCSLSAVALLTRPAEIHTDRLHLVRMSDPHPRRQLELDEFNRRNMQLWLSLDPGGNQVQKILVQSSSGVGPDLFDVYGGSQLQTYVEAGVALDITKTAQEMGFSMLDKTWPAVRGEISEQGRQYSYPANVSVNILIYNKNIFDQLGVPYPKRELTWDAFFALAKKVTRRAGSQTTFGVAQMGWDVFFQSQHGEYFSSDGTQLLLTGEPLRTAFQMHHDMLFKHRVAPTSLELKTMSGQGGWGSGAINQFAEGRFAMINIGKWATVTFRRAHADQVLRLKKWQQSSARNRQPRPAVIRLGSVRLPYFAGRPTNYLVGSKSTAINALSPHRREAYKLLQFMTTREYSEIINGGVDALPSNPQFVNAGLEAGVPDLSELEMHRNTIKAMQYGYQPRRSPFLLNSDVERILGEQISRIESDPSLPVQDVLADAQEQLQALMQRNLDRDPRLAERYQKLTGTRKVAEAARLAPRAYLARVLSPSHLPITTQPIMSHAGGRP